MLNLSQQRRKLQRAEGWLRDALEDHLESPSEATVDCVTEMAIQYRAEWEELKAAERSVYTERIS